MNTTYWHNKITTRLKRLRKKEEIRLKKYRKLAQIVIDHHYNDVPLDSSGFVALGEGKAFIEHFLESKDQKVLYLPMQPVSEIEEILEAKGYERNDSDDCTNGWQVDFWYAYTKEKTITLIGSLWYGRFRLTRE